MGNTELLNRITINPAVMVGKPTIRGLRITVEQILKALAAGIPAQELLEDYPAPIRDFNLTEFLVCTKIRL